MVGSVSASPSADFARSFTNNVNAQRSDAPEQISTRTQALSRPQEAASRSIGGQTRDGLAAPSQSPAGDKRRLPLPPPPQSAQGGAAQLAAQEGGQKIGSAAKSSSAGGDPNNLTEEEQAQVDALKKRDAEVRAHEQAHAAVGGQYASAPTYVLETGPDGKQYAVGGEVQIDTAPIEGDPAATADKMDVVIAAALAPADPSGQDKAVAQQAKATKAQAQAEAVKQQQAELNGDDAEGEDANSLKELSKGAEASTGEEAGIEGSEATVDPNFAAAQQAVEAYQKSEAAVVESIFAASVGVSA